MAPGSLAAALRPAAAARQVPDYETTILIIARLWRLILERKLKTTFRKYFRSSSLSAASRSSPSTSDAVASSHGPLTSPRMLQTATRTRGLFRIRLTFHESASVYT